MDKNQILEAVSGMSVLELSELITAIEEKFGVSAAAPVAVAPVAAGGATAEQTEFAVELVETGGSKVNVIKVVRSVTGLGLKEAKDLVDGAPKVVKEGITKEEAETMKKEFETAGAKVTIK